MLSKKKITIIGGGNLGSAIARGLVDSQKVNPDQIYVTRRKIDKLQSLSEMGITTGKDNQTAAAQADIIILAVKPYNVEHVVSEIRPTIRPKQILVSLATGISIKEIQHWCGNHPRIFRAMPNTAAEVGSSMTCIATPSENREDQALVMEVFSSIGESIMIGEQHMEAATVLGACGIAYVLRFIRAMIQGGIEIGFDAQTATLIASNTVKGATDLLIKNKQHPEQEIDKVTTPKGCTIAGLNEMEHQGFSSSLIKGILTSYRKIEKM